ncbi:MAG: amidase [Burkholderiales bacterium]|nr:amidase [Burkholderiales bacterium]
MPELHELSAQDLLAGYARRAFSPLEVCQALIAHIERWEPRLQATYLYRPEQALQQARASSARWQRGAPCGPLDGVPGTLKENIATAGDPMPAGSAASSAPLAAQDAPPAARLREAGLVLLSKTTMPDWGMLSSGLSSFHRLARNPWDLSRTPGGSSAGAGAAAAAGYGPLHVGTDIGGSLRLPASWCGIFTLKPSLGRVPIDPPYMGRAAGPMTRSVSDAALMLQVLAQPDARDSMSLPEQALDWAGVAGTSIEHLQGLRVGLLLEPGCGLPVEPEITAAVQAAARLFEAAGAHVTPMRPFFTREMLDGLDHFWRMRSRIDLQALAPAQRERLLPYIRQWAESAAAFDGPHVFKAYAQTHATRVATVAASAPFDYVISPVSPNLPAPAEDPSPTNDPLRPLEHIAFTVPWNMSEQPAASINCGHSAGGLPIGLQIAGRRFDDVGVLKVARAFEQLRGAQRPWPRPQ